MPEAVHAEAVGRGCALVTDGATDVGAAVALALAEDGWRVGVHHRGDEEAAGRVVDEIRAETGREAVAVGAALEGPEDAAPVFDQLERELGPVLVLVNNATGAARGDGGSNGAAARALDGSVPSALWNARRTLPGMREAGFGRVVNMTAAVDPAPLLELGSNGGGDDSGERARWAAAKAGLVGMTRMLAIETAGAGVTVNAVTPGFVGDDLKALDSELPKFVPARRSATCEEVAAVVRFLASPEASYVTGASLPVDGGLTA